METLVVEDTIKEIIDQPPNGLQKAVDEVILTFFFHHESLPDEVYIKIKRFRNSVVGHGGLEMTLSRLARQGQASR